MNLHAIDLPQIFGQRRVDGVDLHAIEQMQLRRAGAHVSTQVER